MKILTYAVIGLLVLWLIDGRINNGEMFRIVIREFRNFV